MAEKSYEQMKQEFREFYFKEVKPRLQEYNVFRKKEAPKQMAFWGVFIFTILTVGSGFLNLKIITYSSLPFMLLSFAALFILTKDDPRYGKKTYIKSDYEMKLKAPLMNTFVNIFFENGFWRKSFGIMTETANVYTPEALNERSKLIKLFRAQTIINPFPYMPFEDMISGKFKNVSVNIYETNTYIFNRLTLFIIPFGMVFFTVMSYGLFLVLCIILLIIFSWKIFQYSAFKGLIVTFDMNKSFSGHTFFHENSVTAKKIPFNKSKFKSVNLESSTFSSKYNVYSNNQIEARYILTPALMERIENLSFAFKAKYVRGSFKDNKLTLAIHTGKDMFAMGSDFKDSDTHTFEMLYDEMISILQIVDELKLNEHTGL